MWRLIVSAALVALFSSTEAGNCDNLDKSYCTYCPSPKFGSECAAFCAANCDSGAGSDKDKTGSEDDSEDMFGEPTLPPYRYEKPPRWGVPTIKPATIKPLLLKDLIAMEAEKMKNKNPNPLWPNNLAAPVPDENWPDGAFAGPPAGEGGEGEEEDLGPAWKTPDEGAGFNPDPVNMAECPETPAGGSDAGFDEPWKAPGEDSPPEPPAGCPQRPPPDTGDGGGDSGGEDGPAPPDGGSPAGSNGGKPASPGAEPGKDGAEPGKDGAEPGKDGAEPAGNGGAEPGKEPADGGATPAPGSEPSSEPGAGTTAAPGTGGGDEKNEPGSGSASVPKRGPKPKPKPKPAPRPSPSKPRPKPQPKPSPSKPRPKPKPKPQPKPSSGNPNDKFLKCCKGDKRIAPPCYYLCNFSKLDKPTLIDAYFKRQCPGHSVGPLMDCASSKKDHRACCKARGLGTYAQGICLPFCYPSAGMPPLDPKFLPCLDALNLVTSCFSSNMD